jgi:hypothetical protein
MKGKEHVMISRILLSNRGLTLIETIVVMAIFIVVILIATSSFETVLTKSSVTMGSEQGNIEGIVGLELLRHDIQQAGFGLFSDEESAPTFDEAASVPYSTYNDVNAVPRAIVTDDNLALGDDSKILTGTDYLVIKGTTVSLSNVSQKWSYITDSGVPKRWGTEDFRNKEDKVIAVEQHYSKDKGKVLRRLIQTDTSDFAFSYYSTSQFTDMNGAGSSVLIPPSTKRYYLYGVTSDADHPNEFELRAPFNRTDYIVRRLDSIPASCSPATGSLYKMTMNQSNGAFTPIPIIDCVANMQVVLGWNTTNDPDNSAAVNVLTNADGKTVSGTLNGMSVVDIMANAEEVRRRLRQIKVYILAQDGYRDRNFTNTNTAMVVGGAEEASLTSTVDLTTTAMKNYRWKLYWAVIKPKNL